MSGRFVLNRRFQQEIRSEREYREALEQAAEAVSEQASRFAQQAHAPWMRRQGKTIEVSTSGDSVSVVNTDYAGHLMEWGSKNNPAHAPLRRGVRAAGLALREAS